MIAKSIRIVISILLVGLIFAGCSEQPSQSTLEATIPQPTDVPTQPVSTFTPMPEVEPTKQSSSEIIENMVERMNAGDVEGSLAYFDEDAQAYIIGLPPTGMETYIGKEKIRALWQDSVANHFQWEVNVPRTDGEIVIVYAKTWHDFTRLLEVAPLDYVDVYEVHDGKITTYGTTITPGSLAKFMPAFLEVVPPEEPAAQSTEQPVSEMTVNLSGGTCTIENLAPLKMGEIKVNFNITDQNKDQYAISIFSLDEEKNILDLMASTVGDPPLWAKILLMKEQEPKTDQSYTFTVEKGPIYVVCWSKPPALPIGNAGPIEVIQ